METIYIDRLFVLNLIIDYLILLGTAKVCGLLLRRRRYLIAAILGAVYAAASVLPRLAALSTAPVKLCIGAIMAVIAFGREEKLLRCTLVFFAVSALFGGAVWAVSMRSGVYRAGLLYLPVSMPVLALSFAAVYAGLSLVFSRSVKNAEKCVHSLCIELLGRSVFLRLLDDSGNSLYDPITNSAVMICSAESLSPLFPDSVQTLCSPDLSAFSDIPELQGRLWLIPYSAVGTASGLLPAFRPDKLTIDGALRDDVIVAVSPNRIGADDFDCIL